MIVRAAGSRTKSPTNRREVSREKEVRLRSARNLASKRTRTLGVYSHVDVETRRRAEDAGFDLIVPRSRMAREGAALVERLVLSA